MNKYDNINIKIYMGVNMQDKELVKCLISHFEFFYVIIVILGIILCVLKDFLVKLKSYYGRISN